MAEICHIAEMDQEDFEHLVKELQKRWPDRTAWADGQPLTSFTPPTERLHIVFHRLIELTVVLIAKENSPTNPSVIISSSRA
jgi:hypothetical protein